MKLAWKIIKGIILAAVLAVCGLFIWRICLLSDKSVLKSVSVDDVNRSALTASEPKLYTHEIRDELSKEGLFGAYALVYIADAHQVQFTVRYNDSIFEYTDYAEGTEFRYYLKSSVTEEYVEATRHETAEKLMYNYVRLVFDGVGLGDDADWILYMSVGEADESFDSLPIHYAKLPIKEYKLTKADKQNIG